MKVIALKANNFKRLKAIDITPDPDSNTVLITGKNGAGKSSVLDAIWAALAGASGAKDLSRPVRDGEEAAEITVDLGDYVVVRKFKDGKTTLKVTAADGAVYGAPQSVLDGIIGKLSFDPAAFGRLDAKSQLAALLQLVELPFDVDQLKRQREGIFTARTDVNRDLTAKTAQLAVLPEPGPDVPLVEVSAAEVLAELAEANAAIEKTSRLRHALENTTRQRNAARDEVAKYDDLLADARSRAEGFGADVEKMTTRLAGTVDPDTTAITERLSSLEQTNAEVRQGIARRGLAEVVEGLQVTSNALTNQLEALDAGKAQALASADMPITNLAFDDEGVTYKGVPFAQCSAAEQLRVSMAIAMATNPDVRVIRVTDGSLLDSASLKIIDDMAGANDFQVWLEVVDETGSIGFVIEDGEVVDAESLVTA